MIVTNEEKEKKYTNLNEGHPTLVTIDEVAAQRCRQLASINVVGELGDFLQQDHLKKDEISVIY